MGHREAKRVPLDFDHPLNEVWPGYLMGPEFDWPSCPKCEGDGYSREAQAIANTFYSHQIGGPNAKALAWGDKLGQAEVDHLIEEGRLRVWRDGEYHAEPRTAADVNAEQRAGGFGAHDAINRMILVEFRCERLGIERLCAHCGGYGDVATYEQRAAADEWQLTEPPEGDGWQLWETTSEGSPVSPVFETPEALADWCADNATWFGDMRWPAEKWLASFQAGTTDIDSLLVVEVPHG